MKILLITIFAFALFGCGGGGGGNTPSVQMPDNPPMQNDDGENDNPQMDDMQTDNGENDNPQMDDMQTDNGETMTPPPDEQNYRADPEFNFNYGLGQINADAAYQRGYFGQEITVALLDRGAPRLDHEDLAGQIVNSLHIGRVNSNDDKANDYHSTGVGGIIVAKRNGKNGQGVAPKTKLVSFIPFGRDIDFAHYIVNNNFPIISDQSGTPCSIYGQIRGARYGTEFCPSGIFSDFDRGNGVLEYYAITIWGQIANEDVVYVHATGNHGWNDPDETIGLGLCANQNPEESCGLTRNSGKYYAADTRID